ncbi:MAG: Rne/Rng family ribonuclease [bacterium]
MKKEILINSTTTEARIALLEDGQLVELFVERPETERNIGDVYQGIVRRVAPGMQAAFVDIGWSVDAFVHFSDLSAGAMALVDGVDIESIPTETKRPRHAERRSPELKVGQELLVQITKEPLGKKGPRVTAEISLPGRFLVLVPGVAHIGVSRRIENLGEKRKLKGILQKIRPDGFGLIGRTVAEGRSESELAGDLKVILRLWQMVSTRVSKVPAPARVHKEAPLTSSVIRDLFTPDIERVVVDSKTLYREIRGYVRSVAPGLLDRIQWHQSHEPVFDLAGIEAQIEKGLARKVWFGSGSYLVIEQTEAVVTIDVNSGRYIGKKQQEENNLKVNLQAVREICRQIRFRDLGGIIIIDFIDMNEERNRRRVGEEMRKEMKKDRAKWDIAPISQFGIMELTRQRTRPSLVYTFNEPCPDCDGSGMVVSKETIVTRLECWIKRFRGRTGELGLTVRAHPEVVQFVTKGLKSHIRRIMWANLMYIKLEPDESLKWEEFRCYSWKRQEDVTDEFRT